jgi:hypothetical protein
MHQIRNGGSTTRQKEIRLQMGARHQVFRQAEQTVTAPTNVPEDAEHARERPAYAVIDQEQLSDVWGEIVQQGHHVLPGAEIKREITALEDQAGDAAKPLHVIPVE